MSAHDTLFGLYIPGETILHRLPAGVKLAGVLLASIAAMVIGWWPLSVVFLIVFALLALLTRAGLVRTLWPGWMFVVMTATLGLYQLFLGTWQQGIVIMCTLLGCLYATRALTYTTRGPDLVDAMVAGARPLRWLGLGRFGITPERFGLAAGLMLRSVPYITGTFTDVRNAARARGLERNPLATITPVVVKTMGYALATGDALAARGLGEDLD